MRIAVIGSGYVGLVAGACFADLGHDVILVDNDERKLAALKNGEVPIHENFLPELLKRHRGQRLQFSGNLQEAVHASSAIFVAVGTPPTDRGDADLSSLNRSRAKSAAPSMAIKLSSRRARFPSIPANGCARSSCETAPTQNLSTSLPIPNFCAKALRSPIFFFPTAFSSAATIRAQPKFSAKSMRHSPTELITNVPTPFPNLMGLPFRLLSS